MGRGLDLPERVVKLLRKQFPVCHMLSPYRNNSFPEGNSYETVFQGLQQTQAGCLFSPDSPGRREMIFKYANENYSIHN